MGGGGGGLEKVFKEKKKIPIAPSPLQTHKFWTVPNGALENQWTIF